MRQARPAAVRLFPTAVTRALDGERSSPGASAIRTTYVPVTNRTKPDRAIIAIETTLNVGHTSPSKKTIKSSTADQTGASLLRGFWSKCARSITAIHPAYSNRPMLRRKYKATILVVTAPVAEP